MGDLQHNAWPAARAGTRWPVQRGPLHPLAVGALCVALAAGAWYGLLWRLGPTEEVGATVPRGVAPAKAADAQPRRETRRVVTAPPTPAPAPSPAPAAPRGSPKPSVSKVLRDWASKISGASTTKARSDSASKAVRASAPEASSSPAPKASRDSAPRSKLSPFRRSHPWAAPARGQYYYPSSCPATLQLPDLVFFRSEQEARDSGFQSSGRPACE
jgi:hypothetical protein